jgi:molybdopterin-guanine dinucleotide biosynthesis protein B
VCPYILSIVGKSDSGKTTLILKLLPELKKRGYRVAVAKHCPCGFDLDVEGKDSWKFTQAGGEGVFLTSPGSVALLRTEQSPPNIKEKLRDYFSDFDIVLMEGYNNVSGIRRIVIIRKGIGRMDSGPDNVVAYVSDMNIDTEKRVFSLDDVPAIADFVEGLCNYMVDEKHRGEEG